MVLETRPRMSGVSQVGGVGDEYFRAGDTCANLELQNRR